MVWCLALLFAMLVLLLPAPSSSFPVCSEGCSCAYPSCPVQVARKHKLSEKAVNAMNRRHAGFCRRSTAGKFDAAVWLTLVQGMLTEDLAHR